ncbi:2'-5' RNA ligase family protein [Limnovirga soli]|jgi:2'-5' RNA ligase|uniref:2'-5' RNA ligase family protein n=1 Tax=Limnovirga soli TaxID=2656915 RepID=A0A8J8FGN4_9BACT|nr:2'-5' RNA ligase family protein [Limnovirga soli]NNV57720.1 hypothetical protein [Limnovirga soli]
MQSELTLAPTLGFTMQQMYEYLLVVHPADEVHNQITQEKQLFYDVYKEKLAIKTKPHITVANFFAKEAMEDTLLRYMQRILHTQKSFMVTLNNFSGIPPHTVYARVQDHEPFKELAAALKVITQYIQSNDCPPAQLISHPYLTIARRLQQQVYDKAIFEYSQKTFYANFPVKELVLLRRQHQYDAYKQVQVFRLLGN